MQRLFGCFDLFPIPQHSSRGTLHRGVHIGPVPGRPRGLVAKDVRMPPHQLVVQMLQHLRNGEMPLVGRHFCIKQHLEQQVAQLLGQVRPVAALDGVEDLIDLFQRVFADGIEGLFAVPRAAAGRAQPRHNFNRPLKQNRRPRRIGCFCRVRCRPLRGSLCGVAFRRKLHAPTVYLAREQRQWLPPTGKESLTRGMLRAELRKDARR